MIPPYLLLPLENESLWHKWWRNPAVRPQVQEVNAAKEGGFSSVLPKQGFHLLNYFWHQSGIPDGIQVQVCWAWWTYVGSFCALHPSTSLTLLGVFPRMGLSRRGTMKREKGSLLVLVCKLIERLSVYRTPTNSVETVSGAWYQLLQWLLKFHGTVLEVHGCHVCLVLALCQKKMLFSVINSTCQWQQLSFSCSKFIIIRTKSNSEWADERKPARWKTKLGTLLRGKNWRKLLCK